MPSDSTLVFDDQAQRFDDFRNRKNMMYLRTLIRNGDAIKTLVRKMNRYAQERNLPLEAIKPEQPPKWAHGGRLVVRFTVDPEYLLGEETDNALTY
jgi:hypothetical protein